MKRRRRRDRIRAMRVASEPKGTLCVKRRSKTNRVVAQTPVEFKERRTVYHLTHLSHAPANRSGLQYNSPLIRTKIDTEAAMIMDQVGYISVADRYKVLTSRFCTPNISVMLDNILLFDRPEVPLADQDVNYLVRAQSHSLRDEIVIGSVWFDRHTTPVFGASVLGAFPGLYYRRRDYRNKEDADVMASIEAAGARHDIMRGEWFKHRPCALFGRGKIKEEIEPGTEPPCAGRTVMAPDGRDHLIMQPEAKHMLESVRTNWQTGHISIGLSYPNGGAVMFGANIIADLLSVPRYGPESNATASQLNSAKQAAAWFVESGVETEFCYMVLDISKQDTTVSRLAIETYFDAVFMLHRAPGKNMKRLSRLVQWARVFHTDTIFALPDGSLWKKHRGNVSGSPHTTMLNSWTQNNMIRATLNFLLGSDTTPGVTWRVYGDNTVICYHKRYMPYITLENVQTVLENMFEAKMNFDESQLCTHLFVDRATDPTDSVTYLGKRFFTSGLTWRPTHESLVALVHPDSTDMSMNTRLSRANGLMMDNPGNPTVVHFMNEYMTYLQSNGARFGLLPRQELNKFVFGRGFTEEQAMQPFRMSRSDLRILYTTAHDDPTRENFIDASDQIVPPLLDWFDPRWEVPVVLEEPLEPPDPQPPPPRYDHVPAPNFNVNQTRVSIGQTDAIAVHAHIIRQDPAMVERYVRRQHNRRQPGGCNTL
uniref:RNA-dependent RNA polymerase n=1 Tax=Conidiobolus taihushanensis virus 1 TaxID=3229901 RepID=A0AAU7YT65_9VIRU